VSIALHLFLSHGCSEVPVEGNADLPIKMGMTIEECQQALGSDYPVEIAALDYEHTPTAKQLREDAAYAISATRERAELYFNHHRRLIRIERF
jgi:hypothetical protein